MGKVTYPWPCPTPTGGEVPPVPHQSVLGFVLGVRRAGRLPRRALHRVWQGRRFSMSSLPPRLRGMTWSALGSPSMGWPHSQHTEP